MPGALIPRSRSSFTVETTSERVRAMNLSRIAELAAFDPEPDSPEGRELVELATIAEIREKHGVQRAIAACRHDFGPEPDPDGTPCRLGCGAIYQL